MTTSGACKGFLRLSLFLFLFAGIFSSTGWCVEPDAQIVQKIVRTELAAMRLPARTPFCLSFLPVINYESKAEGEPSSRMLRFLAADGLRAKPGSFCRKAPTGYAIDIYTDRMYDDHATLKVTFADFTPIQQGEHFGTLHHSGTYEFMKSVSGTWKVNSYHSELSEPPAEVAKRKELRKRDNSECQTAN